MHTPSEVVIPCSGICPTYTLIQARNEARTGRFALALGAIAKTRNNLLAIKRELANESQNTHINKLSEALRKEKEVL